MLVRLLEALEKNVKQHGCEINDILYDYDEETCHECQRDCDECRKASHEILKKLKEEAENESSWIPVEQRLPEHLVPVLTCDAYGNMHIMSHYEGFEPPFGIGSDHHRFYEVVAWMPLPTPYHAKEK